MTDAEAEDLVARLRPQGGCRAYLAYADGTRSVVGYTGSITPERGRLLIVFTGGNRGEHALDVRMSNAERVMAHWNGYLDACRAGRQTPVAPVAPSTRTREYEVVIEGLAPEEVDHRGRPVVGTRWLAVVGWVTVQATSLREARRMARESHPTDRVWEAGSDGTWEPRRITRIVAVNQNHVRVWP